MKKRLGFAVRVGQRVVRPTTVTAMGLLVLLLSVAAFADPVPSAMVNMKYIGVPYSDLDGTFKTGIVSSSSLSVSLSDSFSMAGPGISMATFQGSVNGGISPSITLNSFATDAGYSSMGMGVSGEVTADYYYRVSSTSGGFATLTVNFSGGDTRTQVGSTILDSVGIVGIGGIGSAWFQYISNGSTPVDDASPIDGSGSLLGNHTVTATIYTNQWYHVSMDLWDDLIANTAGVALSDNTPPPGAGTVSHSAFIDPTFTLDPAWLAAHPDGQLQFATLDPVPIPGALLLFAPGLAGLAVIRRRLKG